MNGTTGVNVMKTLNVDEEVIKAYLPVIEKHGREEVAQWIRDNHEDLLDHMLPGRSPDWNPFLRALANDLACIVEFPGSRQDSIAQFVRAIMSAVMSNAEKELDLNMERRGRYGLGHRPDGGKTTYLSEEESPPWEDEPWEADDEV
jgi:hypothetical protein